jgi:hypothetical protein
MLLPLILRCLVLEIGVLLNFLMKNILLQIPILVSMRALIINLKVKIEGHIKKMKVLKL